MHVLINAASAHMGGAVTYLRNILTWVPRIAPEDRFTVYVPTVTKDKLDDLDEAENVHVVAYPYADTGGPARIYFDQVVIPRRARRTGADLLFSSTGFGTFFSSCPQALLVRNIAYFDKNFHARYRQLGRSLRKNTLRRWHSLLSIRSADVVLFPTQAMQAVVGQYIALDAKRTAAIHYGFDPDAFGRHGTALTGVVSDIRRWKEEGYAVLLSISTYAVHKNFETLVEALPHLQANGVKVKLLTTVSRDRTTDKVEYDALRHRLGELGAEDHFVELGYVPYQQLGTLYREADLYVFPSFTESFGHSIVEAMASGLPVVAADTPVNREVCGNAGAYFSMFDPVDCADQLTVLLRDTARRARSAEASRARATHFSWRRYTEQLVHLFHDMAPAP